VSIFISDDGGSKLLDEIATKEETKKAGRRDGRMSFASAKRPSSKRLWFESRRLVLVRHAQQQMECVGQQLSDGQQNNNNKDNRSSVRCVRECASGVETLFPNTSRLQSPSHDSRRLSHY
jgi:hypothetical protein